MEVEWFPVGHWTMRRACEHSIRSLWLEQRRIQKLWLGGGCRGPGDRSPRAGSRGRAPGGRLGGKAPQKRRSLSLIYFDNLTVGPVFNARFIKGKKIKIMNSGEGDRLYRPMDPPLR